MSEDERLGLIDAPILHRKTTWAALGAGVFGLMSQAPELVHALLPFVPPAYVARVTGAAAALSMVVGILLNRTAAGQARVEVKRELHVVRKRLEGGE